MKNCDWISFVSLKKDELIKERKTKPINLHSHKWMKKGWFGLFVFLSLTSIQSTIQKCFDCWWMKWRQLFHFSNSINFNRAARANEIVLLLNGLPRQLNCLGAPLSKASNTHNSFSNSFHSLLSWIVHLLCFAHYELNGWFWFVLSLLRSIGGWPRP